MTTTSEFLPSTYSVPKSGGNYFKPAIGDNKVRILDSPILGYVSWTEEDGKRKPVLTKKREDAPRPTRPADEVKHFWALPVWNYRENDIQIWEITQASIQSKIADLANNPDWGSPLGYDITIKRVGEGLNTKYDITASPPKPADVRILDMYKLAEIDLEQLYSGGDPFGSGSQGFDSKDSDDFEDGDIPF